MTSAITRAPAGAAHAHGFAKSLKDDAPAEGFDALFAAVAGAQHVPAMPPVADAAGKDTGHGKPGEDVHGDDRTSAMPAFAASMPFFASDARVVDPRAVPPPANSHVVATADAVPPAPASALENTSDDSTPLHALPLPASQRIVANAAFVILEPVAHALIAHKGHVAESPLPPTADPPRIAPSNPEKAGSPAVGTPGPVRAPVPSHAEAEMSSAPPSSPSTQAPAERMRTALSPRALVQAVMVEVVRSPGRNRAASEAANADAQATTQLQPPAGSSSKSPIAAATAAISAAEPAPAASAPVQLPPAAEQIVVADAAAPAIAQPVAAPKPAPASRAAADIARQRQFVLASAETPTAADVTEASAPAFDALIALRKADGTLDGRAPSAPDTESMSPAAPSGAWLGNLPASATQALNAAATVAMPRAFDQAAWSAALAQQVTASAVAATRETTVRIKPDGLGPIEVRVRVESQHVDVHFAIEHPVTVNMVREALPDLQRMLAQGGLNLGDAQVAQQNAGNRGQAARSDASSSPQSSEDEPVAIGAPVESRPRARVGLLDDFV